jgi:formylglycine-generating enzyme required for sulfatase activity
MHLRVRVIAVATLLSLSAVTRAGENYAFLVAAGNYDKKELNPLKYSCADVIRFRDALVQAGVKEENIVVMHDGEPRLPARYLPEAKKIREELALLLAQLEKDDSLIVALAGHGVQFEGERRSYFCPADARLAERETLIALDEIYQQIDECAATRKLLLVDACRNDPQSELSRSRPTVKLESVTRPQDEPVPQGIIALFSCREGQRSFEHPDLKHGLFFHSILEGWQGAADADRNGKLTLDELAVYSKVKTQTLARQEFKASQIPQQKGEFSGVWVLRELGAGRSIPYDPKVHRKLPAGLRAKAATGADASGWPIEVVSERDGAEMVLVPPGSFTMGSNDKPEDGPQHEVTLRAYYIDKFEVTNGRYKIFVEQQGNRTNTQWQLGADRKGIGGKQDHPVVSLDWEDAQAFCRWAGKQLPTEAQWERAARGSGTGPFPWGDSVARGRCNAYGASDGFESTAPVGKFSLGASQTGCHDMAGNAAEWCRDWFGPYTRGPVTDPTGPASGKERVLRGGSWEDDDEFLFVTSRMPSRPELRSKGFGVRCVFELRD